MNDTRRFADGDVLCSDDSFIARGHLTLDELNGIADEIGHGPFTRVVHSYARYIPAHPDDEYKYYIHEWGTRPSRGAFAVTTGGGGA